MSKRLDLILELINPHSKGVIDVGTDHGYIPVHLAMNDFAGKIIASDINSSPLNTARKNAIDHDVTEKIDFRISDGLTDCHQDEVDTIIIAGLGGEMICDIIDRAEWTMDYRYTIIAQPVTKSEVLRYWLLNNGYSILRELCVTDAGIPYSILKIRYTGINSTYSDAELYVGKSPSKDLIDKVLRSLEKKPESLFYQQIIADLRSMK